MPQEFETPAIGLSAPRVEMPGDPSAQRVTPDEFSAALAALEGHPQEPSRAPNGTLSVGQTIEELGLSVPAEDIWREVQKQRAQKERAQYSEHVRSASFAQTPIVPARRSHWRRWAVGVLATVIIARLMTGHGLVSVSSSTQVVNTPATTTTVMSAKTVSTTVPLGSIIIDGEKQTRTLHATGKPILINSNGNVLTIEGRCEQLIVTGDTKTVRVRGFVQSLAVTGDHNRVTYPPTSIPPVLLDTGSSNSARVR